MIQCKVTGRIQADSSLNGLEGTTFVTVQREDGCSLVAADTLGTEAGDTVLICTGPAAQSALEHRCPVDAAVTARLKSVHR